MKAPPIHLTDKVRELLRLFAADPVMNAALQQYDVNPVYGMLQVSRMDDDDWQILEDKYREAS